MTNKFINWKEIYNNPALFQIYLTARKRGKSETKAWTLLENIIAPQNPVKYAWIRRRWHDSLLSTKPFFQDLIYKFCEEKGINTSAFEIQEQGLFYKGQKRIYFFDLFSYQRARGAIAKITFAEIIFEEAIPIDQEFLFIGDRSEQWIFKDLIESLKRNVEANNARLKITFLANPYLWSSWFLDVFKNLNKLRKLAEEKKIKNDNSGVLEIVKDEKGVEWLLYLNLIEGAADPHSLALEEKQNPSLQNWDDFMIDEPKKYQILHALQDFFFCEIGERKKFKKYCLMHFTKHHKEVSSQVINFCFNLEEKAKSKLRNCVLREKPKLMNKWVNMLKEEMLYFRDYRSRDWFLEMLK